MTTQTVFKVVPFRQVDGTMRFFAAPQEVDLTGVTIDGTPFNLENGDIPWDMIKDKPTEFTPTKHVHSIADIDGLADKVASFAEVGHIHTSVDEIGGDTTLLDASAALSNSTTSRVAVAVDRYVVADFATGTVTAYARDGTFATSLGTVTDTATAGFGISVAVAHDGATVAVAHSAGVKFFEGDLSASKFADLSAPAGTFVSMAIPADDPTIVALATTAGAYVYRYVRADGTWLMLSQMTATDVDDIAVNVSGTVVAVSRSSSNTMVAMYADAVDGTTWSTSTSVSLPAGATRLAVVSMDAGVYRTVVIAAPAAVGAAPDVSFFRFDAVAGDFVQIGTGATNTPDDTVDDQFERAAAKVGLTIPAGVSGAPVCLAAAGPRFVVAVGNSAVLVKLAPGSMEAEVLSLSDSARGVSMSLGRGIVVKMASSIAGYVGVAKLASEIIRQISDIATVVDPGSIQVVDSLESRSRTLALSANQGRILNQRADDLEADIATKVPAEEAVAIRAALDDLIARVTALEANV